MKSSRPTLVAMRTFLAELSESGRKRLPPERQLADRLGVSRGTVRRALAVLEEEGSVLRRIGSGTYLTPLETLEPGPGHPIVDRGVATSPVEIMTVRLIIEPGIARRAALMAKAQDLAELRMLLAAGHEALDVKVFEEIDGRFHRRIALAARNGLLLSVFDQVNGLRDAAIWGRLKERTATADRRVIYLEEHAQIIEALEERDPDAAEGAMRTHLRNVTDHLVQ